MINKQVRKCNLDQYLKVNMLTNTLPCLTIVLLAEYLHQILLCENRINVMKTILIDKSNGNFSLYREFIKLRSDIKNNLISKESLKLYLNSFNNSICNKDLDLLLQRFCKKGIQILACNNYDRNNIQTNNDVYDYYFKTNNISFDEFSYGILPIQYLSIK